ncbi:MAG: hypothetical protein JO125_17190 [Chloroflexi bacterium]|nr:hypothetical protein [Ktedonobacteraceae bacterium]MBV9709131.1 hypothetical protein [Chloroflexota bacterium]
MIKDAVILELSDADLELVSGAGDIEIVNQQVSQAAVINQSTVIDTVIVGKPIGHSQVNIVNLIKKEVHLALLHATRGIHVNHCHHHH